MIPNQKPAERNVRLVIDANGKNLRRPSEGSKGDSEHVYDDLVNAGAGKQRAGGKPVRQKI